MRQHSTDQPTGLSTAHAFRRLARGLRIVLLIALAVLFLVPFYMLVRNGLATEADITGGTGRSSRTVSSGATCGNCSATAASPCCTPCGIRR